MKELGFHVTTKGTYGLIYNEDTKMAEAIGPVNGKIETQRTVVKIKIAEHENPKNRLIVELEKGDY